ncbi:hypothetical protein CIB48_g1468, partial [Xylaria polymorpha]
MNPADAFAIGIGLDVMVVSVTDSGESSWSSSNRKVGQYTSLEVVKDDVSLGYQLGLHRNIGLGTRIDTSKGKDLAMGSAWLHTSRSFHMTIVPPRVGIIAACAELSHTGLFKSTPVIRPSVQSTGKLVSLGPSHTSINGDRKSKLLIPARTRMTGPTTLTKSLTRVNCEADSSPKDAAQQ